MRGWLLAMAAMLTAGPVMAQPAAPPSPLMNASAAPATVKTAFAQTVSLGKRTFKLDEDQLPAVARAIGAGTPGHAGDGGDSFTWLCYTLTKAHVRLWLSGGEGGQLDTVTAQASDMPASAECPAMPAAYQAVKIDTWAWLGMSEGDFTQKLGPASKTADAWRGWHRALTMPADKVDEDDSLAMRIETGKVVYLSVSRTATY
ncbi:MAG: hypothetical protein WDN06_12390 [Asticcacaulis sp.]